MRQMSGWLLHAALALVLFALALQWAWSVTQPLLPLLAVVALGGVVLRYLIQRRGPW